MSTRLLHSGHAQVTIVLLGVLFAAIWSLSFVATKAALADLGPASLASGRLLLAGILLSVLIHPRLYAFFRGLNRSQMRRVLLAGLLSQAGYLTASYWSLLHLPTSLVNIVVSSLPLATVPFAFFILHEQVRAITVVSFILSMTGVAVTLMSGSDFLAIEPDFILPSAILFASVLMLACGNVIVKPLINPTTLLPICALQFLSSGLLVSGLAVVSEPLPTLPGIWQAAPYIGFLAVIGSIVGTLIWFKILEKLPANTASGFFILTPVFGILLGRFVFGEEITTNKVVGVIIIGLAILLQATRSYLEKRRLMTKAEAGMQRH
ncbi:DMT family transporter [Pseudovibrio exalbescens]|uniref:DMT family transporter n=1 Tax=Pseudovibrio exalbescens TaxID=197461 RepID=UPI00236519ED|nr:DMT family transporter [Pseudovibrio exalbescens]MDD7911165.1 DMT family transporter [Pseudovibrio exalbescens]